jgi:hypothetical protein
VRRRRRRRARPAGDPQFRARRRVDGADGHEVHGVPRPQLPEFPAVRRDHRDGADEAAETGAVRAEQDRGVTGEVERSNGIGIVVNVRRVQTRLAAVGSRPLRSRALEPDPGAGRVEVHDVARAEEHVDVVAGEELRCAVRALRDGELPLRRHRRPQFYRHRGARHEGGRRRRTQHVTGDERAAAVAAEAPERER